MWDLPRPGLEPVSPALAGRFSTTAPPGKPLSFTFNPHLHPRIPVAQTHVRQDREREQVLRNNSVCDNEVHRVVVPGMFLLAETGEDLEEEQVWGSLTLACN